MPRAIWSGSISFGLVNIPIKLYSAVTERSVRFNQIDRRNGARIRQAKTNAETGEAVPTEELVKGYEVSRGRYVLLSDEDLESVSPEASHTMDLEAFIDLADIDPIYFNGAYHVAPDERAAKPYALLARAMEASGRVAIARFVMRSKQHVAVLRVMDGRLLMSMLVYADELNPASGIPEFRDLESVQVSERELDMASSLIDSLAAEFDPAAYHDTYREQVLDLIDRLAAGQTVEAITAPPAAANVVDLMAALEASVAAAKEARGRHPSAGAVSGEGVAEVEAAAGPPPAGKVPAKKAAAKKAATKRTRRSA